MQHELYEKLINDGILKKHNLKAYMKVVKMFQKSNRVGIVHATGTGKSFIALQLMYDNSDKKIIYLVPRNGIGDQIEEHIDGLSLNAREKYFKNVEIMSYQKLIKMTKEELEKLEIDYLITDEFHHIGAPIWTNAINLLVEAHPNLKIFGMTATPIRSRGTNKQENIADTFFEGHIASTYTLGEALLDRVLMPPIYKGAVYKLEEKLNKTEKRLKESNLPEKEKKEYLERIENAKKQVLNADSFSKIIRTNIKPNGKYIVFCPRGKREEYQLESERWFNNFIDEENITRYFVDSKHEKQSKINSDEFYNDHDTKKLRLMFAMDMYTEGIHVPDIDGIIMMRPTKSDIMFYQMLGRGLNKNKQTLVLDFVNNYEYIIRLKDYVKKELETRQNDGDYSSNGDLKKLFEQFDIELENINILNILESIDRKIGLTVDQKIEEIIELMNNGYIPKSIDKKTKFSNGEHINYFWSYSKDRIKEKINTDSKYITGYELAKKLIEDISFDKIDDYIELLNQGYIPRARDKKTKFKSGEQVNSFWMHNKEKTIERLNNDPKYQIGYELAKETIKNLLFDKIEDFIELLNKGYTPKARDTKTKFSNGEKINYFWADRKDKIIERLNNDPKYQIGYEQAHKTIKNISFDKIEDFIELLNQGYIPKSKDTKTKFKNGELVNSFWIHNKEKTIERLNNDPKYKIGYELAKETIKNILFDKIEDYIELLNQGYIPKSLDKETKFSNGEQVNYFWSSYKNKEKIIEKLNNDTKYKTGYELAKKIVEGLSFDKKADYIELLNQGYIPRKMDTETKFKNGEPINQFWNDNKNKIIERLNTDSKYAEGYELAKRIVLVMTLPKETQKEVLKELKEELKNITSKGKNKNL